MNDVTRIAKNSIVQGAGLATEGLTEFVVALVLARWAGPERLGEFTTLIILAGLFAFISGFGLPSLLTREIARLREHPDQVARMMNAAVALVCVLSMLAFMLMLVLGLVSGFSGPLFRALLLTAAALGMESLSLVVSAAFRGFEEFEWSAAVTTVMQVSFLGLAALVIFLGASIDLLMLAYLASRALALVVSVVFYRFHFGRLHPSSDITVWRALLRKGFPFSVNSIFSFVYSRMDVVILSYLAGNTAVGFYDVAYSLTMRLNVVARAVTFALYPFMSHKFAKDERAVPSITAKGIYYLVIPGFLISTLLWAFGDHMLALLYGGLYASAAAAALRLLALVVPLRFVETLLASALDASNRAGKRATAVAVAGIANMVANFLLVPTFQMMGAVYATMFTEVLICGLFMWSFRHEAREMVSWRTFLGPAVGTLLVAIGPALFRVADVWFLIPISFVVYVSAVVAVDPSSVRPLRRIAVRRQT